MVCLSDCPSCRIGRHDGHVRNHRPAPEGMLGGFMCPCEGQCEKRGPDPDTMRLVRLMRAASKRAKSQ